MAKWLFMYNFVVIYKLLKSNTLVIFVFNLVFLLISNLISWLRLHQFLGIKTTETNKSLNTDAKRAN